MGQALAQESPAARAAFQEADDALGFALSQLCFEGPEEELLKTENTQPAILAASIAAWRALRNELPAPSFVAGHSLGEYSALVAAGALGFADALRLVRARGRFMQEAVPPGVGAMAAILRLPEEALERVLSEAAEDEVVVAANFNSPGQVVLSGHAGAVARAMDLAKAAGAKRAVPLPVSAPFHSPLMIPAQHRMSELLAAAAFGDLAIPLISNVDAAPVQRAGEAREGLVRQISGSVRWTQSIRWLTAQGITRFLEVGPGKVLAGLIRQIEPAAECASFGEPAARESALTLAGS
jgi:[acyl-carrier-protein] S-malonyltransferase